MNHLIEIQNSLKVDQETAWNAYTSPEHIVNWNFASDDWCCPSASNNLHVGGTYVARMEAKDGSFGFDFQAIYTTVEPFSHIGYEITDGRKVEVKFVAKNGETEVIVSFEPENENSKDLQRQGWQAILDNYKKYTETLE